MEMKNRSVNWSQKPARLLCLLNLLVLTVRLAIELDQHAIYLWLVDNVRVCKIHGGSLSQSEVVMGVVVARAPDGTVQEVQKANVAVFVESIDVANTDTKGDRT